MSRFFGREYLDLAFVPRWAIVRTQRQQNVAEHSFYVALFAEQFARLIGWKGDYYKLLGYALYHDLAECFTSDIPGPIKHQIADKERLEEVEDLGIEARFGVIPFLENLSSEIKGIVKIADGIEECSYLQSELQLGNGSIFAVYESRVRQLREKLYQVCRDEFKYDSMTAIQLWTNEILPAIEGQGGKNYSRVVHG